MQLYCIIIVISSRPHTLSPTLFPYTTLFRSPTEPSFGTDLAGHARDFRGKRRELVHHRVDGVLELEDLALDVHRDLLRQVPARHGFGHVGDIAHLTGQVARHRVHTLRQVLPRPGHALHVGLAAELALGADLAPPPRPCRRPRTQLVGHCGDALLP